MSFTSPSVWALPFVVDGVLPGDLTENKKFSKMQPHFSSLSNLFSYLMDGLALWVVVGGQL